MADVEAAESHRRATAPTAGPLPDLDPRRRVLVWIGVAAVHIAVFAPLLVQAIVHPDRWPGPDDFTDHLRLAVPYTFAKPWNPGQPEFAWHLLVKLLAFVIPGGGSAAGSRYLPAAVIVSLAFVGATGIVWYEVLRLPGRDGSRMRVRWASIGSLVLVCMEAPSVLTGWASMHGPFDHFGHPVPGARIWMPLYAYHGPTGPASRPLTALTVLLVVRTLTGDPEAPAAARARRLLPYVAVAAMITKPTISVDLVPAATVMAVVWARRDRQQAPRAVATVIRRLVVPCVVVLAVQYALIRLAMPTEYQQHVTIRPLRIFLLFNLDRPFFWTALLLPLAMAATWRRRLFADRFVELTAVCAAAGFTALLLLSSSNPTHDGPEALWWVVAPTNLFLLFGTRRAAELLRGPTRRRSDLVGAAVCAALAVLYVFSFLDFSSCQLQQACLT